MPVQAARGSQDAYGRVFHENPSFEFDTGGPSVIESRPWANDDNIDEEQAFILVLDSGPDQAAIVDHASFSIEGLPQRVGVRMILGAAHNILAKRFARVIDKRPFVIIQAQQRFPNGAAVHLIWGRGIKSSAGIATREDQQIDYRVRKAFAAKVDCERENPKAGCVPVTPIRVHFTAQIRSAIARRITLVAPDGTRATPRLDSDSDVADVEFEPAFKESAAYKLVLPANLTDDSGRTLLNASRFPYTVTTGEFPPMAKFSARFGIIESADPVLPLTVRNLEADFHGSRLKLGDTAHAGSLVSSLMARIEATLWRWAHPIRKPCFGGSGALLPPSAPVQSFPAPRPATSRLSLSPNRTARRLSK
jgi:hypothetical protein